MKRLLSLLLSVLMLLPAAAAFAADPVPVQSITLDVTEASLPVGRRLNLKASLTPTNASNKQLEWTTSDENIAKVSNGQVAGVSPGTATITVTAADGSGASASAVISVVNPVTKIVPEKRQLTLPAGVGWELFWTVEPEDATNKKVVWTSSNEGIATVTESGVIFTHKNGLCSINGFATDGSGAKVTVNLTVKDHEIMIINPGQVEVDFETEDTIITEVKVVKGKETTVKTSRYFKTDNGCVMTPEDMVLRPVKAGSDTVSIQFIQKRKTVKIEKHTVFVARSAVGEAATFSEDGTAKPIRFLSLRWGSSFPEAKEVLEFRGRTVHDIAQNNDDLRSMIKGDTNFANLTAYSAALNFSYDHNSRMYEVKNSLFKGDLYFHNDIPFEEIVKAVRNVYSLDEGEASDGHCVWERDHIRVELSRKERFTLLELTWDGEPVEEDPSLMEVPEPKEEDTEGEDPDEDDEDEDSDDGDSEDEEDEEEDPDEEDPEDEEEEPEDEDPEDDSGDEDDESEDEDEDPGDEDDGSEYDDEGEDEDDEE